MHSRQILLDMDGVLANFIKSALVACGRTDSYESVTGWECYKAWGLTEDQFYEACRGYEFWWNLAPYPWATELYQELSQIAPVTIATSPSRDPDCCAAKLAWLEGHLGIERSDVMLGAKKFLMAHPLNVLIDDSAKNIHDFRDLGGATIGFKQPWNKFHLDWRGVIDEVKSFCRVQYVSSFK